ncbi:fatty acid synthase subunit beta domain-containing protein [Nocardia fusca]|uniref:fatty acid synthase subunit beta domain-containing protein n=1 Tax=Nocardia fusca TaxID=941183 RepID=UPI003F4CC7E4
MTIDDSAVPGLRNINGDNDHDSAVPLIERISAGEPYALAFGGQGAPWLDAFTEVCDDHASTDEMAVLVARAASALAPVAAHLLVARPLGFDPLGWSRSGPAGEAGARPGEAVLRSTAVSVPGVLLTQLAGLRALEQAGLDPTRISPVAVVGHSQGVLAVAAAADRGDDSDIELLAIAQLIGAAGAQVGRRLGLVAVGEHSPMVAVSRLDPDRLRAIVAEVSAGVDPTAAPVVSIRNARRQAVLSGPVAQLARVEERCAPAAGAPDRARGNGTLRAPVFERLPIELAFHHPALVEAVELAAEWAGKCGLDVAATRRLARQILVDPVDWVASLAEVAASGARWVLDIGPGDLLTRLTAPSLRGTGIGIVPALTRPGQRHLRTPGATPAVARAWGEFAPRPVTLPDGRTVTETAFTRLTGRSPILLAGMTPTTVDAGIVAAAANAGHWAELAGGGQVTEQIFADRMSELRTLLEPGRAVQFNSLLLDPYLWSLQLGGKRLVQRARAAGAPIDGVVVTAGIPELDAAVALIEELIEAGIPYIAFKPGTVAQIREVVRIADELPRQPLIVHIEGGRAGGHHSWEDLDELLLETYAELRLRANIVVCAGGGIGTPDRAADYLTGAWSRQHGYPPMPLDGVLVGTAAMATAEATTAPEVKQLLVDTPGTPDRVAAGTAVGGIASGRSQLGADIHEIDNTASRTGRLLDEVAGDAAAVAARRAEIIDALNGTAKPYFGELGEMTYAQWLRRYLALAVGTPRDQGSPWLDSSWRDRFAEMLQRAEARLHPADRGAIPTLFADSAALERPSAAVDALITEYPAAETTVLHPADMGFFVALCRTPGKPVNFVPVVDADVRRWWRSDSLWQAHDPRYAADQVCVIPGPVAVAGITRVDEPVGELLDRFEQATTDAVLATGVTPEAVPARRRAATGHAAVDVVLGSPDVLWAGRSAANPVHRLGDPREWTAVSAGALRHGPTGATLVPTAPDRVELSVPLAPGTRLRLGIGVPAAAHTGGAPVISAEEAETAMSELLGVAAGGPLPEVRVIDGRRVAHLNLAWTPDVFADHAGVVGAGLPESLSTAGRVAPDVLVGACWPAVFAVLGAARGPGSVAVIEGLLDLVHLDHRVRLLGEWPAAVSVLTVRAESGVVLDTEPGRLVEVRVTIGAMLDDIETGLDGPVFADLVERFVIRGRAGSGMPDDPPRAADSLGAAVRETPRRRRRELTVTAPLSMAAFAEMSGDHNPIHTSDAVAALAGLGGVIVHGMWLSAVGQYAVSAVDPGDRVSPRTITAWTARFLGMVRPGERIDIRVDRIAVDAGAEVVEVTCRVGDEVVMQATGRLAPPKTVYAFPGQGIQRQGMGLDAMTRSRAVREVWERADAHTRRTLGFSILAVVRDNPISLRAGGVEYRHPDGVLHLTQFTQAALATLGVAQIAELREAGAFVEGSLLAGHSLGEYVALAAVAGVLPLETLLEIVFQRGQAMDQLVPRTETGHSDYGMVAIRPSQIGLTDRDVVAFVTEIGEHSGEFLEVVNLNLRDAQYSVAGTLAGLRALELEVQRRRALHHGERAFVRIPGVDVPFHSRVLRAGVADFRAKLTELLPAEVRPEDLVGRYIPNLVPVPFSLARDFLRAVADLVPSEPLEAVLAEYDTWAARPAQLCRTVLIELLAWQFASPVRWIETQDLLFTETARGGLGVQRFVEVGLGSAPTLANLAARTLRLPGFGGVVEVLNVEREAATVYATDFDTGDLDESADDAAQAVPAPAEVPVAAPPAPPAAPADAPRPDDIPFTAADAATVLIGLWTKLRPDQIGPADTIEGLCDGVSSRRNQLLVDLAAELSVGAIDGAADAEMTGLTATVRTLARTYRPFGPVLTGWLDDHLRKALGPSGRRPAALGDRVRDVWGLGDGWAGHITAEVALGTREGTSVRGGDLGSGALTDGAAVDAAVDAAVQAVAARYGVTVHLPAVGGTGPGAAVDAAALGDFAQQVTGPDGVLATAARAVLDQLGLGERPALPEGDDQTAVLEAVSAELGPDWPRLVAPVFDARRAVRLDDRWATAREDLARFWTAEPEAITPDSFTGAGENVAAQALWWRDRAAAEERSTLAEIYEQVAAAARATDAGEYAADIAVVTGASKGSIAAAVAGGLLAGGATVVATTSRLDDDRLGFYRDLYRRHARPGAALWVVPANLASYRDVDALIEWIAGPQTEHAGGVSTLVKPAMTPTLLLPFAAPRVSGDLTDAGARAELEMRVLLWSVKRLIGGLSTIGADTEVDATLHVVLPGSPNRGMFGGDGAYGEAKAALDAVVAKWRAEKSWSSRVTLVHALIGWVRGTALMGGNDPLVEAVEAAGVQTWSAAEMADQLLTWCSARARAVTATGPHRIDLTGGLAGTRLDLPALAARAAAAVPAEPATDPAAVIAALPNPPRGSSAQPVPHWRPVDAELREMVVIVGAGELGPYGSARTRFEMEVSDRLSAAGVLELAWTIGLVTWENDPAPGWYDTATGEPVPEAEIADRYHDTVLARTGIRRYEDEGALRDTTAPLLASVFLEKDMTFTVGGESEARAFAAADGAGTVIAPVPGSTDWTVTRRAGTEVRVPRRVEMTRTVGGQIPAGFDPTRWGISADMVASLDRLAVWNIVTTVDAFIGAGFDPVELLRWVHPARVANTMGTGLGALQALRSSYVDLLLGEERPNDILQETLLNVTAAHVVQSYIGSYGSMIHPVGACATAAVSVEEGYDKIRFGKADFVVAGGADDLSVESVTGFADMAATADSAALSARGIADRRFSRANDRRRAGFVESQGGGTVLLTRGDIALELGLPVLGVVAYAQSFGDGVHSSIPAPGIGALAAGLGRDESELAANLRRLGVTADDIAVLSKHDTSTAANDPNESELHERLAAALGRTDGNPLFVISQKTLTGHAKGGAAAFQLIGLCQVLAAGVVPPNRSLDCVDDVLARHPHLVWPREPLRFGQTLPLRAGLLTSLGFGHVSCLIAVVHPEAFVRAVPEAVRPEYQRRAEERILWGRRRFTEAMCGGAPLYEKPADRRLGAEGTPGAETRELEAEVLLSRNARLAEDGVYRV